MTPEQRSIRARLGAHTRWANTDDRTAATAPARKAWEDRWLKQADPDGVLPMAKRIERAESLKKAHFQRMALASSMARAKRRSA